MSTFSSTIPRPRPSRETGAGLLLLGLLLVLLPAAARAAGPQPDLNGDWVLNADQSDDTDRQVERAIKAGGGHVRSSGRHGKERYRGGPADQAFYDHISYDETLHIRQQGAEFQFDYPGDFRRVFFSDGRGRVASASGSAPGDRKDYSFAYWEGDKLVVESRPLDGGQAMESYSLTADGTQLRLELRLQPLSFQAPIEILRVFERPPAAAAP